MGAHSVISLLSSARSWLGNLLSDLVGSRSGCSGEVPSEASESERTSWSAACKAKLALCPKG